MPEPPSSVPRRPAASRGASLRYASDQEPGYRRVGKGTRVRYLDGDGNAVRDAGTLERCRHLAIPPAWTDVWICVDPQGHLQAVGRDARGRKQYRYHPEWRRRQGADKHERVLRLAQRLPRIRAAVERDLRRPGMPREKVLALLVCLLERTYLRVGNEEYERQNGSFGLTTMRDRHASTEGAWIRFRFRGKGGKMHEVGLRDRRLAGLVRRIQELRGQQLFEYLDDDGARRHIRSDDLNDYLRDIAGVQVSAKDFRTWAGTVLAFRALRRAAPDVPPAEARRHLRQAFEQVGELLGNTATVSRQSYVDPTLVTAWQEGALARVRWKPEPDRRPGDPPTPAEEAAVLRLLKRQAMATER
ncbi:DNA topoisomerase IB [soil metagenome]